ncbi:DUF4270 family protein [Saccharicrinis sp. FJH54]|uniref:DUF4270 family protein n=1 Tax=Saccharicrinis sp. FJH54 TaxID=3344665 RepID=UPI0035D4EF3E
MNFKPLLLVLIVIAAITGCTQDENIIGGSISPLKDKINVAYVDSVPFKAFSFKPAAHTLRTDGGVEGNDYFLLGGLKPDIADAAGIKGDIAMEFWYKELDITQSSPDSILVVDSVLLVLLQNSYDGDSTALHFFEVYELDKLLSNSEDYFADENPEDYYSEENKIGEKQIQTIDFTVPDSIRWSQNYMHHISIPLSKSIGERIIENYDDIYNNVNKFRELFKGVYIKTTFGSKAMMHIYPFMSTSSPTVSYTDFSALNLVYHYNPADTAIVGEDTVITYPERDTSFYAVQSIVVNNECPRFNVIRKNYGDYDFSFNANTVQPSALYLQGLNVSKVRLKFPAVYTLDAFKPLAGEDSARIAINSAKLTLQIDKNIQDINQYFPPVRLLLRRDTLGRDTIGNVTYIPDEAVYVAQNKTASYTYGTLISDYTYEFNIAEYIQDLFDSKVDHPDDLILSVSDNVNNPGFVFLNGLTKSSDNLKLEIVYTRY